MTIWEDLAIAGAAGIGVGIGVIFTLELVRTVRRYISRDKEGE